MAANGKKADTRAYETDGEHLAAFLLDRYLGDNPAAWDQVAMVLLPTGRADEWKEAMREMTALHLTRRLIAAGVSVVDTHGESNDTRGEINVVAEKAIKQLVLDTMIVDFSHVPAIYARLAPAIRSARRQVGRATRREIKDDARRTRPYCYLCAIDLDFSNEPDPRTMFTIDHVWPRAYGGNSQPENLLPACKSCNERKGDTPSWSMYPVQALLAGHDQRDEESSYLQKEMRFAVQSRTAVRHAKDNATSLKDAFISLGRPATPLVVNPDVSIDVFNLAFTTL